MRINKILKISIVILFAFVFTDIALSSGCNPPVITSPNDNEVYLAGGTYIDLCKATGDAVIAWSGPGEFDPTTGCCSDYNAPCTTGTVTITATNSYGSDQVQIELADIIYVDEDAAPDGGGTSWADAFDTLQEGLNDATSGNHIWVAEGEYLPGASQSNTFLLVAGVEVYGGFDPTIGDDTWAERDFINNVTTLSGDIDDDDTLNSTNSRHVVTCTSGTSSTVLDGFTITMGFADSGLCDGAGMKIVNASPTVSNCIFKENKAHSNDGDGGGMGCYNSSPEVTNCIFIDNIAGDDGGALVNTKGSNGTFTNCVFYNNNTNGENLEYDEGQWKGKSNGGAIWNTASEEESPVGSSPTFINCLIAGNSTVPGQYGGKNGGGVANKGEGTDPVFINCTFTGNTAYKDGGGMCTKDYAEATVINCIFWDNKALDDDDSIRDKDDGVTDVSYSDVNQSGYAGNNNNISQDPKFFDTDDLDGPDNLFMTLDDGAEIGSDSPCIDTGNNTPVTESYDIIGRTRIIDGDEVSPATVDMGAYEFQLATVKEPYLLFLGTNTEMMVRWELNQDKTCTIEWGTTPSYGYSAQVDDDVAYPTQYLYRHTIAGLTVGTKYYYRVRGVGSGTFYSAPASDATAVKFLAYGDTRGNNNVTPVGHDQVCYRMVQTYEGDSDFQTFALHVADWVDTGQDEFDWQNEFFLRSKDNVMEFLANMPLVGCMGNHEHNTMSFCNSVYAKYFPFPGATTSTDDWYEIKYGPVHIVVINEYRREQSGSGSGLTLNGTALAQVKSALVNSDREWTFLMFHAPAYSARGGHANNPHPIDQLEAWINNYVDIVFAGHNHYYARCEMDGVRHITTGGGGAPLRTPQSNPGLKKSDSSYHHCEITIDGTDIQLVARRANNTVIETVSWSH
ncbi:MAG: fibronectin type III domain-containing protein [Planctomycetota bacterium]|jgi:hypothetical protein